MQDLTKIDKPFGLLDKETKERLKAHGGPYQLYFPTGDWHDWERPSWKKVNTYRAKPQPEPKAPEKPEVKVGSWWRGIEGRVPFEVLCIYGDTAYIVDTGAHRGRCMELNYITRHCTPYTPPRKCEAWVNVYADGNRYRFGLTNYGNEQNARDEGSADELYIATIKIEYTEGQDND